MMPIDLCSSCGRTLPGDAPMRLCPACLLEAALFDEPAPADEDTHSEPTGSFGTKSSRDPERRRSGWPRTDPELTDPILRRLLIGPATDTRSYDTGTWIQSRRSADVREIPNYEIRGVLGRGGMGIVYLALQCRANRMVALKMIRGDDRAQDGQIQRFRQEIRSVAALRHPNVVQIFEVGEHDGRPFFSLELLEGGTLKTRLATASMTPPDAAQVLLPLARAVHEAHRAGIVHRDLKPSNVLFDKDGTPKVADFGLAKRIEAEDGQTETGQVVGTPCYMAPEQARGDNHAVGPPADVYALGAIFYEMLAGRPPFKGATTSETIQMVITQDPVRPTRFQPRVPRDLETICLKCLEKEPTRRYQDAGELAEDLRRYLSEESILARPTPAWERAAKWSRRRPTLATLAASLLVAAIGLGALTARAIGEGRREAARIERKKQEAGEKLADGRAERARDNLAEARTIFKTLLGELGDEPRLADLARRTRVELAAVEARLDEAAARAKDLRQLAEFRTLRDLALLQDGQALMAPRTLSGDATAGDEAGPFLDVKAGNPAGSPILTPRGDPSRSLLPRLEGHPGLVRRGAIKALEVFGRGDGPGGRPDASAPLPDSFTEEERAEVEAGRSLMLIVLSDAVARPLPGESARGQAREALALLDQAARRRPSSPALHLRRASCFDRLGDAEAARRERDEATKAGPADAFDHLLLGQECSRRGEWEAARAHFEEAVRTRDDPFWAHVLLAIAQLNGPPALAEAARVELSTCLSRQPSYGWLSMLRGYANGRAAWAARSRAVAGTSPDEAEGRFEAAEADFLRAMQAGLDDEFIYALLVNRGVIRFQRGRLADAAADFERAIALDDRRYNAFAALAQVYRRQGRRADAIDRLDRAIEREPRLAALHRGRALARLDRGEVPAAEKEQALRDLETSAHLEPPGSLAAAGDHLGRARVLLSLRRAEEARVAADAALAIAPDLASAHLAKVAALVELKQFDRVAEACDVALARGHATHDLHRIRGLIRVGKKDFPGAIDDYTRALSLNPDDPTRLRRDRGWAYLFAGAPEPALDDFEAVIARDRSDPDGFAGRAAARVRLGQYREAVADASESLRLAGPSDRHDYNAAQVLARAAALADDEAARHGGTARRDAIGYEARAVALLRKALEQTPAEKRAAFWDETISRDPMLRPILRNPLVKQRLQAIVTESR